MSDRVKVLQVTGITVGGSAEHVLQLCESLPADRFDVRVALSGGGPLDAEIKATGLPVLDYAPSHGDGHFKQASPDSPPELARQFWRLRRHIREVGYDVVHTHTSVAGAMGRIAAWSCRTPVRVHMAHAFAGHEQVPQPRRWVFRQAEKVLGLFTTHVVVGSAAMRAEGLRQGVLRAGGVTVIHYAARMPANEPGPGDRERLRADLGLPPDAPVVALVGRIEDQKGVDHLLAAAPAVVEAVPQVHFVVVGDGSRRAESERQARELGLADRVHFTGWRHDLAAILRGIDVLAVPSRWEAFGIVNLEAMSAAKPVVAFAVEGIPEVVLDGVTGLLCPAGDRECLARSLVRVLTDPELAARLGRAGFHRFQDSFSPRRMVDAHVALYERELARGRQPQRRGLGGPGVGGRGLGGRGLGGLRDLLVRPRARG